jgi:hypothetical protein
MSPWSVVVRGLPPPLSSSLLLSPLSPPLSEAPGKPLIMMSPWSVVVRGGRGWSVVVGRRGSSSLDGFYKVLYGFYKVLYGFIRFYMVCVRFYMVLHWFYMVLIKFIWFV